jgi:hypothetical protein
VSKYQVMPPLSAEEYAALKNDIAEHGVKVPVDTDEDGNILDGHHRAAIADELGIAYETRVVTGLTDDNAKREHALTVNLTRSHLSREQRRQLIAHEIGRGPDRTDRDLGRLLGCDHKTVGAVRRTWASGEFPQRDPEKREPARPVCRGCAICTGPGVICHYLPGRAWSTGIRLVYIDGHGVVYDSYGAVEDLEWDDWRPERLPNGKEIYVCRRPLADCGISDCHVCAKRRGGAA